MMDSWKNYYAIDLIDTVANNIKYAKQMGHDYIAIKGGSTPSNYINNPECVGLKFYINNILVERTVFSGYPGFPTGYYPLEINVKPVGEGGHTYTQAQKDWYSSHMVWGYNNQSWPYNFATGYHNPSLEPRVFTVVWDFQQQAVIDEVVEKAILVAKSYQNLNLPFTFAGYIIDTPRLQGPYFFLATNPLKVRVATIRDWTGTASGLLHSGITHEYSTYEDGMAAFYKKMNIRMRQEFPDNNTKWIIDPYVLYKENPIANKASEWVFSVKDRSDKVDLTPDMLTQEAPLPDFIDNPLNFNSGVNITKDMVGCSQSNTADESVNRLIAAKAGINGAWYVWFLMFGSSGTMPKFQNITDVYSRLKLVRCVPNWDNLNNVALVDRTYNNGVYQSTKSKISSDVIYSRHWKTGKLFVVFNTINGIVNLNAGEIVTSVKRTDGYFIETTDGISDVSISGLNIILNNIANSSIGKCYIITTATQVTPPLSPSVLTAIQNSSVTAELSWQDNSNNEDGFKIEHSLNNNEWNQIATVSAGVITYTTGILSQVIHYFRVRAYNAGGNSLYTNIAQCNLAVVIVPIVPADPTTLVAAQDSTTSIKLTWYDLSNNEDGFRIEHSLNESDWAQIATVGINIITYTATGLDDVLHYFRVRAYNSVGNSGYTNTAQYDLFVPSPGTTPDAPTDLTGSGINTTSIKIDWKDNADNELGFKIEHSLDGIEWTQITTVGENIQTYTATGLENILHYFRVRAYNAEYNSDYSNIISLFPAPPEPEPIPEPPPETKPYDPSLYLRNYFFVDSGLTYLGDLATVIGGLEHLEGREVSIMADGIVQPKQHVINGQITLTTPASIVHVGLAYISVLQTMRPEQPDAEGTSQGRPKRINQVVFKLLKTKHFKYASENKVETLKAIIFDDLFSGNKEVNFPTGINRHGHITIVNDQPTPITILAIIPEMGVS